MIFFLTFDYKRKFPQEGFLVKQKNGDAGLIPVKTEALYAELKKERKQPPVVILQQVIFYNIFILCLWLRIITRSSQGVQFMKFPSQVFFNDINYGFIVCILKKIYLWLLPFYTVLATYCYYEKVHRTMCTAIVSYLLKNNSSMTKCNIDFLLVGLNFMFIIASV